MGNGGTTEGLAGTVKKRGRTVGGGRRPSPSTSGGHSPMANTDNTRKRSKVRRQVEERQDPQGERTVRGRNGDEQRTSTTGSTELEDAATSSMNNITPMGEEEESSDPTGGRISRVAARGKVERKESRRLPITCSHPYAHLRLWKAESWEKRDDGYSIAA